ncbi:MAG: hypothetical protein ACHQ50_06410 [Fimbriimonadales bacterium]
MLSNSTFRPVHDVVFERIGTGKLASGIVADAPGPWLRRLNKEGVERLGVSLDACPFDIHTTTPEPWGILSDGDVGVEIWQPVWRKRIRTHTDLSPWHVTYVATRASRWSVTTPFSLGDAEKLLRSSIQQGASVHPYLADLGLSTDLPFPDMYPADWPIKHRELGEHAARTVVLLRSEEWAQVILRRELDPKEHDGISQKLWKAALMALEASARTEEQASGHPTFQSFRFAG